MAGQGRELVMPDWWGTSPARREEWSKCVARYTALSKAGMCVGDGEKDLPGKSTPTSSGALDHLASIATEELRRSKCKRSIIDRPLGEAPVPVVERVLNHWLTGLFRTASGETMAESLFAPDAFVSIELSIEGAATPASLPRFQIPSIKYFLIVLNHWLTGLFRTASGETASAHTLAYAQRSTTPARAHAQRLPTLFQMAEALFEPNAFASIELSIEGAATPGSLPRFQIPSIKYFLMWDRAIFSKYNTSAYHIDYVLENLDGSVAVQIRYTPTLLNGEQPTGGQEVIMQQLWEVTGGGRVRSFQRFCAASPTTEAAAPSCAWVSPFSRRALEGSSAPPAEDAPLVASWSAAEGDGGAGDDEAAAPPSTCAWVSPLSRRALERVRGSFGEDAPLARASWSAEEGDGGAAAAAWAVAARGLLPRSCVSSAV
eukprot:CAMPEP_0185532186 /NCGR_PEP_ID=MMETSP1366-20130426/107818_1 /TAXON_ID=38817 /ORGANISM="Gephyrocapsa oceanica, Strain RCC1303" /LENGTH=429 /DNA_ID=CAMNT_0028143907 /DNA_START=24 /DNA_END=1317 /DNA_ORIENTATION=-